MLCLALAMLMLVNSIREEPLQFDYSMLDYANARAEAQSGLSFSHEGAIHAETIVGGLTVRSAFEALINSPPHYSVLVDERFTRTAIGVARHDGYIVFVQVLLE